LKCYGKEQGEKSKQPLSGERPYAGEGPLILPKEIVKEETNNCVHGRTALKCSDNIKEFPTSKGEGLEKKKKARGCGGATVERSEASCTAHEGAVGEKKTRDRTLAICPKNRTYVACWGVGMWRKNIVVDPWRKN